jgi:N-carbamoylputrescine amidase
MNNGPTHYAIGLVQMAMTPELSANVSKAMDGIADAARQGAKVVCLPELFRSPYFCQQENAAVFDLAEPIPGPTTERLCAQAKDLGVILVASLFEKRAAGLYHNTAVVIDEQGTLVAKYRKMHIPDDPHYYEKFYFAPGDLGFTSIQTSVGRLGVLVCWDQWYPEAARLTALSGAEVLLYPTAIGWHPEEKHQYGQEQRDAWRTIQRSHAIANGTFVCSVNRIGHEPDPAGVGAGVDFWGTSFLAGPFGATLVEGPTDAEAVLIGVVDRGRIEEVRRGWPFLRDRRIDAYSDLTCRYIDPED